MAGTLTPMPNLLRKSQVRSNNKILPKTYVDIGVRMLPLWRLVQEECKCVNDSDVATILVQGYFEKTGRELEAVESYIIFRELTQPSGHDGNTSQIKIEYEEDMKSVCSLKHKTAPKAPGPIHPSTKTDLENHSDTQENNYETDVIVKTEDFNEGQEDQPEALSEKDDQLMSDTNEHNDYDSDIIEDLEMKDDENDSDFRMSGVDDFDSDTTESKGKNKSSTSTSCSQRIIHDYKRKRKILSNDSSDSDMVAKKKQIKREAKPKPMKTKIEKKPKAEKKPQAEKNPKDEEKPNAEKNPNVEPLFRVVKRWIKIKLDDHKDKFTMERLESYARKNRGVDMFDDMYSCLVCGQFKTINKELFEEHIEKHVNKALECDNCNFVSSCPADLKKHRLESPSCTLTIGKLYVCHLCGEKLYSKTNKKNHMGSAHNIAEIPCLYCPELFTTNGKRKNHYHSVHREEVQYCPTCKCEIRSISKQEYLKHIQECVPGHQCQVCGKLFTTKTGLHSHNKCVHLKIRKYKCELCPYTAFSSIKLKNHILAHNDIHPHQCDQCTFTCVSSSQLKSHMRTHTGEKPYKCDQCNYAAAWNVQLKEHMKVHT